MPDMTDPSASDSSATPAQSAARAEEASRGEKSTGERKPAPAKKPAPARKPPATKAKAPASVKTSAPAGGKASAAVRAPAAAKPAAAKRPSTGKSPAAAKKPTTTKAPAAKKPAPRPALAREPAVVDEPTNAAPSAVPKPVTTKKAPAAKRPAAKKKPDYPRPVAAVPSRTGKPPVVKNAAATKKPPATNKPAVATSAGLDAAATDSAMERVIAVSKLPQPATAAPVAEPPLFKPPPKARPVAAVQPSPAPPPAREASPGVEARTPAGTSRIRRWIPALLIIPLVAVTAVMLAVNTGDGDDNGTSSQTEPIGAVDASAASAADWLTENAALDQRLIVDDDLSDDLVGAGWNPSDVIDSEELASWRDADFLVATEAVRESSADLTELGNAIENSVVVASFGEGSDLVEVRMITPEGAELAAAAQQQASAARAEYGAQLAVNPALRVSDEDRELLTGGRVDPRIIFLLATLASQGDVTVSSFPVVDGEQSGPIRQVALADVAGTPLVAGAQPTDEAAALTGNLTGMYAPTDVSVDGTSLLLRYAPALNPLAN